MAKKDSSFRVVLFEFILDFIGFFLPACKISLFRCFSGCFSIFQPVEEPQMDLFPADIYVSPISAISKDRYPGNSGAIISVNFPPEPCVFNGYVLLMHFSY